MNEVIQGLWIGGRLSTMERLCVRSFLCHGHKFHLYAYGPVENVPMGTCLRDASEILPAAAIFQYENGSYAGFANFFRYKLLLERGGWWVDMDTVCLRPFDFQASQVFSSEMHHGTPVVNCGMIKTPPGSAFSEYTWRVCESKDPQRLVRGETGPRLAAEAVNALGLHPCVVGPATFCPVDPDYWEEILDSNGRKEFAPETHAVHLWNEIWRFEGLDKDASYSPGCLYERLKSTYLGSESLGS
jgi:hypothetical protein